MTVYPALPPALAERVQPMYGLVSEYLASNPSDFTALLCMSSRSVAWHFKGVGDDRLWRAAYAFRWKAFFDYLRVQKDRRVWRDCYRMTVTGEMSFLLEVHEREKMPGFAMAAMSAWTSFAPASPSRSEGFVVEYVSASAVKPEFIPLEEQHRIRCCPHSVCEQLEPGVDVDPTEPISDMSYPNRVLEGFGGLRVGKGVELQWKMQLGSPFGWWFGRLEALELNAGSSSAVATIVFEQIPKVTRWHRLKVQFGDGVMRHCAFGGYSGGIRGVTAEEEGIWAHFRPDAPQRA